MHLYMILAKQPYCPQQKLMNADRISIVYGNEIEGLRNNLQTNDLKETKYCRFRVDADSLIILNILKSFVFSRLSIYAIFN